MGYYTYRYGVLYLSHT